MHGIEHQEAGGHYAAACLPHNTCVAIRAPSTNDFNFAHIMVKCTRRRRMGSGRSHNQRTSHNVLAADDLSEPHDALCDQFRMLDDVGSGVAESPPGIKILPGAKRHGFPHSPLMSVAWISSLECR